MKTYKVTLISKDGQKFEVNVNAYSDDEAIQSGLDVVNSKQGWHIFEYRLHNLERLT